MPVPTETLRNTRRLNIWFALSAVLLLACTGWLIAVDHFRAWKKHQADHQDAEAVLAHLDYLTTQQESFQQQLASARQRVDEAARGVDPKQNAAYATLLDELSGLDAQHYNLDLEFKEKDARIVVTRSDYEKALALDGPEAPSTRRAYDQLQDEEQGLADARGRKEAVEDRIKQIKQELGKFEQPYKDATRALGQLRKKAEDAQAKRDQYSSDLRRSIFNAPLFDFAAPPGTPGKFEVKQVVTHDVKVKLNFLEGYKVDRCTTCHVVIDNPEYSPENLVRQFEEAIPAIQEELRRKPAGPGQPDVAMPEPPPVFGLTPEQLTGHVAPYWNRLSPELQTAYFQALQEQVNSYLRYEGMPEIDLEQPLQAHPDLDLFLSLESPHPMSRLGCTVCHEGNGQETDFVLAAHTPKTNEERREWTERYYDTNLGVPTMTWSTLEHFWDFPMIPPKYSEAGCAKCHTRVDDIGHFAGKDHGVKIRQGQELFLQSGCINCHTVGHLAGARQVGTDLAHVGSKLTDGFMHNWIHSPRDFRPTTWMPHFFLQENNGPGSENEWDPNPVLRTQTEVMAITHYLKAVSKPWKPEPIPDGLTGDPAAGQQLFAGVGCLACHGNIAEYGQRWIVDDLAHRYAVEDPRRGEIEHLNQRLKTLDQALAADPAGSQAADHRIEREVVTGKLKALQDELAAAEPEHRARAEAESQKMDLNAQAHYAMLHFGEQRRAERQRQAEEENILAVSQRRDPDPLKLYVPPEFSRFAPDLSGIGSKVTREWLYSWLREPRHYASYTKMPRLRLTEQEALDLTEYLMTLKHDSFDQTPFELSPEALAELDLRMTDLLSGQNSQATIETLLEGGELLTDRLLADLAKASNPDEARQRREHYGGMLASMSPLDRKMMFFGQKMITHYGCYACHAIDGFEGAANPGTELTEWGEKNIHQLDFAFFSGAFHTALSHDEHFHDLYPAERSDLIGWSATGNVPIDVAHTHASFATHKLLNPRIWDREKIKRPYEKLKMPNFYFTDSEVEALVTFLLSRRPARVADGVKIDYDSALGAGPIAAGRQLTRELNCIGCHKIEDNIATMHQFVTTGAPAGAAEDDWGEDDWDDDEEEESEGEAPAGDAAGTAETALARLGEHYGGDFDVVNGPPWLRGEGAKVQFDWLHGFLLNVEVLRPWETLRVRMPSFYLTSEQAAILVDYFAALSESEAQDLAARLKSIHEVVQQAGDPKAARGTWQETLPREAHLLADYAVENELINPLDFDFANKDEAHVHATYDGVLANAEFFAHLYDVEYPYTTSGYQPMDKTHFELGEALFQELRCLSCHVLGDPGIPGSNTAPTAPNLALAHRRLRYEWFHQWLQEPAKIQPGTKMPQWFPGGQSAFSEEMGYTEDMRTPLETRFTAEGARQMHLLMDFIWQAGLTNHTSIDPQRLPAPAAASPQTPPGDAPGDEPVAGSGPGQAAPMDPAAAGIRPVRADLASASVPAERPTIDPATAGPVPVVTDEGSGPSGSVWGQVRWTGDPVPPLRAPVPEGLRGICSNDAEIDVPRLRVGENGALAGAVVYLPGQLEHMPRYPESPAVHEMSIQGCVFDPPLLLVPRGSTLRLINEDAIVHNVLGRMAGTALWSRNLERGGAPQDIVLDQVGIVQLSSGSGLDWMRATIWVVDHAGHAVTTADGGFILEPIPAGEYDLQVWHPGLVHAAPGTQELKVEPPLVAGGRVQVQAGHGARVEIDLD